MTAVPYPIDQPIPLPKLGSWPETVHVFDRARAYALAAAEAARRPLLVRGEPGTGKSQLARAAAVVRQRLFVSVVVNARIECQDLQWHFDAVGRLGEAQMLAQAQLSPQESVARLAQQRFLSPGPLWWAFDWASAHEQWEICGSPPEPVPLRPEGWQPQAGCVLLIDEMDKAEADLPNSLLETLGNGDFPVPYRGGAVRQSTVCPAPLVIITTNEERELPAAFLRRCLVLQLALPQEDAALSDFLCQRGAMHFPACAAEVRQQAASLLLEDRHTAQEQGLPPPDQAEYLDLLRAVCAMAPSAAEQVDLLDTLRQFVLQKSPPQ